MPNAPCHFALFCLYRYSGFQNQVVPFLSCLAGATRRLALFYMAQNKDLRLLAAFVVISLYTVLEKYHTLAKCEVYIHIY